MLLPQIPLRTSPLQFNRLPREDEIHDLGFLTRNAIATHVE